MLAAVPAPASNVLGGSNLLLVAEEYPQQPTDNLNVAVYLLENGQYVRQEMIGAGAFTTLSNFNFFDVEVNSLM